MTWNGIDADVFVGMFLEIHFISAFSMNVEAHGISVVAGERPPEGGYPNLQLTPHRRDQVGLWTCRNGYLPEQRLCIVDGHCLDQIFIPDEQLK